MSDGKKTSWGKGLDAVTATETTKAAATEPDAGQRQRARNQDVLPGILGKQLRAAYGELLNSPVPDAISDLIKKLETTEPVKKSTKSDRGDAEDSQ